jgi:hypothetical protein
MAKKSKAIKNEGKVVRVLARDVEITRQIGAKLNLPGMPEADIIRVVLRRQAEALGIKVA